MVSSSVSKTRKKSGLGVEDFIKIDYKPEEIEDFIKIDYKSEIKDLSTKTYLVYFIVGPKLEVAVIKATNHYITSDRVLSFNYKSEIIASFNNWCYFLEQRDTNIV